MPLQFFSIYKAAAGTALAAARTISILLSLSLPTVAYSGDQLPTRSFQQDTGRDYLVVGKITNDPKKHIRTMKPIADYMATHLGRHGINGAKIKFAKNLEQMIQYLNNGEVDYVTETSYGAARMMTEAGAQPLLLRWKKGQRDYQSIIFAHQDSGIDTLSDLVNRTIVFEDAGSTSSFFIPRHELEARGLSLVPLASPNDSVPSGKVGYLFSGAEQNTSALVYSQLADAGAVNNHDWDKPDHMPAEQRKHFKKLFVSEPLPRSIELVHPALAPVIRDDIQQLLLDADNNDSAPAQKALRRYQKTRKFETLTKADLASLNRILNQLNQLNRRDQLRHRVH